jgi:hypothetical protein
VQYWSSYAVTFRTTGSPELSAEKITSVPKAKVDGPFGPRKEP